MGEALARRGIVDITPFFARSLSAGRAACPDRAPRSLPVRYRDLSRTTADRNRHRGRTPKSPSTFGHADPADTVTRIAPAVITLASTPA